MATGVRSLVNEALKGQYKGLWVAVEMTWTQQPDISCEDVASWKSDWNELIKEMPVVLLCQYDQDKFSSPFMWLEFDTHLFVIHEERLYLNSYFFGSLAAPKVGKGSDPASLVASLRVCAEQLLASSR